MHCRSCRRTADRRSTPDRRWWAASLTPGRLYRLATLRRRGTAAVEVLRVDDGLGRRRYRGGLRERARRLRGEYRPLREHGFDHQPAKRQDHQQVRQQMAEWTVWPPRFGGHVDRFAER